MPSTKAICIHGHFYQPPREDPLTGIIPTEPGAKPYKNWNERIHAECYRPNAQLGNFQQISFNIGPTLLSWMSQYDTVTYQQIVSQEQATFKRYGVGNAMAQAYNHTILPLASNPDKEIQITWGIADFEHRFGHKPLGMWLPETAVDKETLIILAKHGIKFTILAPWQTTNQGLDPTEPYRVNLSGGQSITIFFYEGDLSARMSFDPNATANADDFALHELSQHFNPIKESLKQPQLLLLASDGELFGHHQPFREQFLAHLLNGASEKINLIPIFPALWLIDHHPEKIIEIRERTSWSCHHGVLRWSGECDCTPNNGHWKSNLRKALDHLAAELDGLYFESVYPLIPYPRMLRQRYISALLGEISPEGLILEMAGKALTSEQTLRIHLLLESQRERQRMFTSCGWFFDDFNRIEPKNNIAYAAQAVRLARIATGIDLSPQVKSDLKLVQGNYNRIQGDIVFERQLQRAWDFGIKNGLPSRSNQKRKDEYKKSPSTLT